MRGREGGLREVREMGAPPSPLLPAGRPALSPRSLRPASSLSLLFLRPSLNARSPLGQGLPRGRQGSGRVRGGGGRGARVSARPTSWHARQPRRRPVDIRPGGRQQVQQGVLLGVPGGVVHCGLPSGARVCVVFFVMGGSYLGGAHSLARRRVWRVSTARAAAPSVSTLLILRPRVLSPLAACTRPGVFTGPGYSHAPTTRGAAHLHAPPPFP